MLSDKYHSFESRDINFNPFLVISSRLRTETIWRLSIL